MPRKRKADATNLGLSVHHSPIVAVTTWALRVFCVFSDLWFSVSGLVSCLSV